MLDYHYELRGGDWVIRYGISEFLVAEGPGWTRSIGLKLLHQLRQNVYRKRRGKYYPFE